MAPAAVQTKQSVSAYSTSAPALFTHASMAGALTPSRSPITSTRFPLRFIVFLLSRFHQERHAIRGLGHPAEEQASLRHEQIVGGGLDGPLPDPPARIGCAGK